MSAELLLCGVWCGSAEALKLSGPRLIGFMVSEVKARMIRNSGVLVILRVLYSVVNDLSESIVGS